MLRASRLLPLVSLLALAGCPGPRTAGDHALVRKGFIGCLPLEGTSRSALRMGPDGHYLYWTEQVRLAGYDDTWPSTEVVRWPLDGGAVEPLTNLLDNPYHVLSDGRLVGLNQGWIGVWGPSGGERISTNSAIDHLELLATQDAVVYRKHKDQPGDPHRDAVWWQPLRREGSRWLADADALLGVDGNSVIVRFQDNEPPQTNHLRRIDGVTGQATELPWLADVIKAVPGALVVQNDQGIWVRPPEGGEVKAILPGPDWQIRVGPDGVKAWRKVGPRLDGALIGGLTADKLPPVLGGDSLEGFVRVPDGRVAYLVGHDLDGDGEVTTGDEVDVCLAAAGAKEVRVEPRTAPDRWQQAGTAVAAFVKDDLGGGSWHFASGDAVPGIYVDDAPARKDEDAIRADIRALADKVGTATGDHTLFAKISYADGKRGFSEWWAATGRRVTWSGVGGATVPDLADYDVTFAATFEDVDQEDDDSGATMVHCKGTVTNRSDHRLVDLWADCIGGDDDDKIRVTANGSESTSLEPGQTGSYDGVVRRNGNAVEAISIHTGPGRDEVPGFDLERHARFVALDALAADIADRTDLLYEDADVDGDTITVHLAAMPHKKFADWSTQAQEQAAATAHDALERADPVLLGGEKMPPVIGGGAVDQRGGPAPPPPPPPNRYTIDLKITEGGATWKYIDGEIRLDEPDE